MRHGAPNAACRGPFSAITGKHSQSEVPYNCLERACAALRPVSRPANPASCVRRRPRHMDFDYKRRAAAASRGKPREISR